MVTLKFKGREHTNWGAMVSAAGACTLWVGRGRGVAVPAR